MTGQWIGDKVLRQRNTILFGKPADREDGRLVSLKNHLIRVWMPVSFIESERETQWGCKVKGPSVLRNISWNDQPQWGDVLVSFFLQPWTGGQGSLRQAIMCDYNNNYNNKGNKKQRLKSKKQIQGGVLFSFSSSPLQKNISLNKLPLNLEKFSSGTVTDTLKNSVLSSYQK